MGEGVPEDAGVAGFDAGLRIAGYRLQEEIARGGMAVVFRAWESGLTGGWR